MNKKDKFEITFFEGVLHHQPLFIEALHSLGDLYTKNGDYEKGLSIDKRLEILCPQDPIVLYNLACSYSLLKKVDQAYFFIKESVQSGYDDFDYMKEDKDLNNLRKDLRFKKYWEKINQEMNKEGIL